MKHTSARTSYEFIRKQGLQIQLCRVIDMMPRKRHTAGRGTLSNQGGLPMKRVHYDLDTCMDIFDWFDAPEYDYLMHILAAKLDGEERLRRALPNIQARARKLVRAHRGTDRAYPAA